MRSIEEITSEAIARRNPKTNAPGYLTRQDIYDYIQAIGPETASGEKISAFLETLPFLTPEERKKIVDDVLTYGL